MPVRASEVGASEFSVFVPVFNSSRYLARTIEAIVQSLFGIVKDADCYKVALQCKENDVEFYRKCGYEVSGVTMQRF